MCGLRIFAGPLIYHLLGNIIYATVGLVYINVQPEYELPSSTCFGQFEKFGQWSSPQPSLMKNFCAVSEILFIATCASDVTFL